jgi:hypothetical protein
VIDKDEMVKIARDMDYIHSPKHANSLKEFLNHYPNGAPDSVICKALGFTQLELDDTYKCAIVKLREGMGA